MLRARTGRRLGLALLLLSQCFAGAAAAADAIAIIVSKQSSCDGAVSLTTLRRIYLGRVTQLFGRRVERFDLQPGSATREAFGLAVLDRTESALREYWLEQALTGGPVPPREVPGSAEMVERISRSPAALGYLAYNEAARSDRVCALRVLVGGAALAPSDPGYPLRQR